MNSGMTSRDIATHVSILGWLYIVAHSIFLLIGGFIFLLLTSIGVLARDADAMTVLGIIGVFVGGLMVVLALPGLLAGYGLLRRRNWGRVLALVVGVLNLPNFPLGTLLGVYAFYVLLQTPANDYFAQPSALS